MGSIMRIFAVLSLLSGCYAKQSLPQMDRTTFSSMRVGEIEFAFPSSGQEVKFGWEKRGDKSRLTGQILVVRDLGGSIGTIPNTFAFVYVGSSDCPLGAIGEPKKVAYLDSSDETRVIVRSITACFDHAKELDIVVKSEPWPHEGRKAVEAYGDSIFARISRSMTWTTSPR